MGKMEEEGEKGRRSRGGEVGKEEEGKEEEEDKMKKIAIHLFAIVLNSLSNKSLVIGRLLRHCAN